MKSYLKIDSQLLADIRKDLGRRHSFAHERIGFLTAGAALTQANEIVLLAREYEPVDDEDYVRDSSAGAVIGPEAMRKGLQRAYKTKSSLIHIHTHGGFGKPSFSQIDLRSAKEFVPSFFNAIPRMPHGIMVLSNDSAQGLFWYGPTVPPVYLTDIISVGSPYKKFGG